ncbi:MAG: telomerase inhibitor [Vezdaea aestivalis]|nr:MAG: telomerase inhibitor [Vezdaea aestivalis]
MGLSAPRKRVKLSQDPNNTRWSNSTTSYGQKIMKSQGWTSGQLLGAQDALHVEHHTAANASHIRAVLREGNLGLGARKGGGKIGDDCTGLDAFESILGRLNGKDEKLLQSEERVKAKIRTCRYVDSRWGMIHFVKGGLLVGDEMEEHPLSEASTAGVTLTATENEEKSTKDKRRRKSREGTSSAAHEANSNEGNVGEVATDGVKDRQRAKVLAKRSKKKTRSMSDETPKTSAKDIVKEARGDAKVPIVKLTESSTQNLTRHHPARRRALQQKRMASMDARSMKEGKKKEAFRILYRLRRGSSQLPALVEFQRQLPGYGQYLVSTAAEDATKLGRDVPAQPYFKSLPSHQTGPEDYQASQLARNEGSVVPQLRRSIVDNGFRTLGLDKYYHDAKEARNVTPKSTLQVSKRSLNGFLTEKRMVRFKIIKMESD